MEEIGIAILVVGAICAALDDEMGRRWPLYVGAAVIGIVLVILDRLIPPRE